MTVGIKDFFGHAVDTSPHQLSDRYRLAELADSISRETGQEVTVGLTDYRIGGVKQTGYYSVHTARSFSGPYTFGDAWNWLQGYRAGALGE